MNIVIASDSFKESLSSNEVNNIIESAILEKRPNSKITNVVIADGGEGTVDALLSSGNAEIKYSDVTDALNSGKVSARWALFNNGSDAIIEVASVIGLNLLPGEKRNPLYTTSLGVGELIIEVMNFGVKNIFIGLGGSSTNDGGTGALRALGFKFLDEMGCEIPLGGMYLNKLRKIDSANADQRLKNTNFILLSDVRNILCGAEGASQIFAAQKGASREEILLLDAAMYNFQTVASMEIKMDLSSLLGGGAAGGIGAGFSAFLNGSIKSGIHSILELIKFDKIIENAHIIITGEGKIDNQTKFGKTISGVVKYGKQKNIPVFAFCAIMEGEKDILKPETGLQDIFNVVNNNVTKKMSMENPEKYLYECVNNNLDKFI